MVAEVLVELTGTPLAGLDRVDQDHLVVPRHIIEERKAGLTGFADFAGGGAVELPADFADDEQPDPVVAEEVAAKAQEQPTGQGGRELRSRCFIDERQPVWRLIRTGRR